MHGECIDLEIVLALDAHSSTKFEKTIAILVFALAAQAENLIEVLILNQLRTCGLSSSVAMERIGSA